MCSSLAPNLRPLAKDAHEEAPPETSPVPPGRRPGSAPLCRG